MTDPIAVLLSQYVAKSYVLVSGLKKTGASPVQSDPVLPVDKWFSLLEVGVCNSELSDGQGAKGGSADPQTVVV